MGKSKKKKATKYDPKLAIKGSFKDVISVSVGQQPKEKAANKSKEKKPK